MKKVGIFDVESPAGGCDIIELKVPVVKEASGSRQRRVASSLGRGIFARSCLVDAWASSIHSAASRSFPSSRSWCSTGFEGCVTFANVVDDIPRMESTVGFNDIAWEATSFELHQLHWRMRFFGLGFCSLGSVSADGPRRGALARRSDGPGPVGRWRVERANELATRTGDLRYR